MKKKEPISTCETSSFRDGEVRYLISVTDVSNSQNNVKTPAIRKIRTPLEEDYDLFPTIKDSNYAILKGDASGNSLTYSDVSGNNTTKVTGGLNSILNDASGWDRFSDLYSNNLGYNMLDTDNDKTLVYMDEDENNIEEAIIKMSNAWNPSTTIVPTNVWEWSDISGGKHPLHEGDNNTWGKITSSDEPGKDIVIGCQIDGVAYTYNATPSDSDTITNNWVTNLSKDNLIYNLRKYNIKKDGNNVIDFSTVSNEGITYEDVPISYSVCTEMTYNDVFTTDVSGVNAYPIFDTLSTNKKINKNINLDTLKNIVKSSDTSGNELWNSDNYIPVSTLVISNGKTYFSEGEAYKYTNNRFMDKFTQDYITDITIKRTNESRLLVNGMDTSGNYVPNKYSYHGKRKYQNSGLDEI
jgi:hypothetical protein